MEFWHIHWKLKAETYWDVPSSKIKLISHVLPINHTSALSLLYTRYQPYLSCTLNISCVSPINQTSVMYLKYTRCQLCLTYKPDISYASPIHQTFTDYIALFSHHRIKTLIKSLLWVVAVLLFIDLGTAEVA